jgi:hypothetical protein
LAAFRSAIASGIGVKGWWSGACLCREEFLGKAVFSNCVRRGVSSKREQSLGEAKLFCRCLSGKNNCNPLTPSFKFDRSYEDGFYQTVISRHSSRANCHCHFDRLLKSLARVVAVESWRDDLVCVASKY